MTPYEIPLSPEPQRFTIELGGAQRQLRVHWSKDGQCWVLDLFDARGAAILLGVPVVTGCDLLGPYRHLGLGGSIIAQTDHSPDTVPTFENLGTQGRLYFVVT